jgi:hypothetical protein
MATYMKITAHMTKKELTREDMFLSSMLSFDL